MSALPRCEGRELEVTFWRTKTEKKKKKKKKKKKRLNGVRTLVECVPHALNISTTSARVRGIVFLSRFNVLGLALHLEKVVYFF